MKNLFSIRMRATKKVGIQKSKKSQITDVHISGAEGLYKGSEIQATVKRYVERALHHPKGTADSIVVTIEELMQKPREIQLLPVATIRCGKPVQGEEIAGLLLQLLGISKRSIGRSFQLIKRGNMRGAALITAKRGCRLEPDTKRGVRASRLGIDSAVSRSLSRRLQKFGINTDTVKEALILASKVISCEYVIAELCISDDPDYTTGYVASKYFGYLRIPHIKPQGSSSGGRAFFVNEGARVKNVITYLEKIPVLATKEAPCRGIISADEILSGSHK